jgi:hypothetical protein
MVHTHSNAINFQMISLVIIPIDGVLPNNQRRTDGKQELRGVGFCGKKTVNVVHSWNDSCKIWGSTREKECRILKNLQESNLAV